MTLTRNDLIADLDRFAFAPSPPTPTGLPLIGAEVELVLVDAVTRRPARILTGADSESVASLPVLQSLGRRLGWREERSVKAGVPEFHTADGGRITFEPGGQLEFSAAPSPSLTQLTEVLVGTVVTIRAALADSGIEALAIGLDPANGIDAAPLQLNAERYRRMDAHFGTIGANGARMMRQTASIQLCVDNGPHPLARWRLLNALTPYLVAMFANSPLYNGEPTGHQSARRGIWGALDPARTGIRTGDSEEGASAAYADFALGAGAILLGDETAPVRPFGRWIAEDVMGHQAWRGHLSTLFPEVRPRGYFEVRSCDAVSPEWYAAPLALVVGLAYGPDEGTQAMEIAGEPDASLLERAGRCGLSDPVIAARATALADLAIEQCAALGGAFVSDGVVERAADYFSQYTRMGRAPASDLLSPALA